VILITWRDAVATVVGPLDFNRVVVLAVNTELLILTDHAIEQVAFFISSRKKIINSVSPV
jgi:hypothetical protein